MEQEQKQGDVSKAFNFAMNACFWTGWQFGLLMSKPGTAGYRYLRGPNAGISLVVMYGWALVTASEALLYGGSLLALASMAEHRRKSKRGDGNHSWSMGVCRFAERFGEQKGRALAIFLAVGGGLMLMTVDLGAGSYLACAGIGHAFTLGFIYDREAAIQADLTDAQIEGAHRAGHNDDRPLF